MRLVKLSAACGAQFDMLFISKYNLLAQHVMISILCILVSSQSTVWCIFAHPFPEVQVSVLKNTKSSLLIVALLKRLCSSQNSASGVCNRFFNEQFRSLIDWLNFGMVWYGIILILKVFRKNCGEFMFCLVLQVMTHWTFHYKMRECLSCKIF